MLITNAPVAFRTPLAGHVLHSKHCGMGNRGKPGPLPRLASVNGPAIRPHHRPGGASFVHQEVSSRELIGRFSFRRPIGRLRPILDDPTPTSPSSPGAMDLSLDNEISRPSCSQQVENIRIIGIEKTTQVFLGANLVNGHFRTVTPRE